MYTKGSIIKEAIEYNKTKKDVKFKPSKLNSSIKKGGSYVIK